MRLFEHLWYRLSPAHVVWFPLSLLFGAAVRARRTLYRAGILRARRLAAPVIVVGNLTVGGTGKTPLVLWLASVLQSAGYRPGIVTRGYGGSEATQEVAPDSDPAQAGDEAVVLARRSRCPVWAGRDRVAAGRALLAAHPACNAVLSDDGMQHYRLARDVEIAVVDGERGFGNGLLLPAGPLREPRSRLRSVDAVVINGEPRTRLQAPVVARMRLAGEVFRNVSHPDLCVTRAQFASRTVHAVAGIGSPKRFFDHLAGLGVQFVAHPFPDHHRFDAGDLAFARGETVLMTEKDAVKCAAFARESWWYLPVEADVDRALADMVLAKLKALHGRQAA
jgi:tetraacyldisaccharide 4'-kinase